MSSHRIAANAGDTADTADAAVVIVGAGVAGHSAAERLREQGYTGPLHIVGEEPHHPYNRTPLSKQLLTGGYVPSDLTLRAFTDLDATWHLGVAATSLDLSGQTVRLADETVLPYTALVLATGVTARHLPGTPLHSEHVHVLRTLADAHDIDRSLSGVTGRVAVVGGGFIGCELASTARARGLDVTIIDVSPVLLHHGLGDTLGRAAGDIHTKAGVALHLGVAVKTWEPHDDGVRLILTNGEKIDADMAVVGVGTDATQPWLTGSGLDLTGGIAATATCHAIDSTGAPVPAVVVAGDAACWPNRRFDDTPRRIEHWINAVEMGRAAAENLLAGPAAAIPFMPVPRFWSEQHGIKIQSAGMPRLGTDVSIITGSVRSGRFLSAFTQPSGDGDRLVGLIAFDAAQALLDYAPLIGESITQSGTLSRCTA